MRLTLLSLIFLASLPAHADSLSADDVLMLVEEGTVMPLEEILEYASLREQGACTVLQHQVLLEKHQQNLKAHIEQQQFHLAALENKIDLYKNGKVG